MCYREQIDMINIEGLLAWVSSLPKGLCSPHHFIAKRSYGSASVSPSPFHAAVAELTRPYHLESNRYRHPDKPTNWPRSRLYQPHRRQVATAFRDAGLVGLARCRSLGATAHHCLLYSRASHLGSQHVAKRSGPPRDTLDVRGNRGDLA